MAVEGGISTREIWPCKGGFVTGCSWVGRWDEADAGYGRVDGKQSMADIMSEEVKGWSTVDFTKIPSKGSGCGRRPSATFSLPSPKRSCTRRRLKTVALDAFE